MKNRCLKFVVALFASTIILSGCGSDPKPNPPETIELVSIKTHGEKIVYSIGDSFVKPGVTATYTDNSTKEVANECSFDGFSSATAGLKNINVYYTENGISKNTQYSVMINENVSIPVSIEVTGTPKTEYEKGDNFVKPNVTINFSDGSTADGSNKVSFSGYNLDNAGTQTVTVTLNSDPSIKTTYQIVVRDTTLIPVSIEVTGTPKTEYEKGDNFVKPNVTINFSDGSTADGSNKVSFSGYNLDNAGTQTVTVTLNSDPSIKTTYQIVVKNAAYKMRFAIFADVQLCNDTIVMDGSDYLAKTNVGTTVNGPTALKNHLMYCKKQGIDTILMNGDITNQANEYYYDYFNRIVESVYGTNKSTWPEFVMNMGNHEWWAGVTEKDPRSGDTLPDGAVNAVKLFNDYARIDSDNLVSRSTIKYASNVDDTLPSYYKVINGVPFITVSAESSAGIIGNSLREEIESWLDAANTLDSVKAGGPIFVQYHYALHTSMTHGEGAVDAVSTIENIFKNTPNAIIFTGDTHYPGVNERSINQVDFTTINLGSSSYSRMVDKSAVICDDFDNVYGEKIGKTGDIPQGNIALMQDYTPTIQVVNVSEENVVKINRYFSEDGGTVSKVGPQWQIDPIKSKSDFTYTNERFQKTESAQALYGKDGLEWENTDEVTFGINPETNRATVLFPDVTDFHCVEHYKITINSTNYDVAANYYTNPKERTQNYYILDNVPSSASYSVTVTAYDFYDNPSTMTLTSTTNDVSKTVDEIDNQLSLFLYSDISKRLNLTDVGSENSHSSNEFYYKGLQTYAGGATTVRVIDTGKNYDVSDKLSFNDAADNEPVFKFKAKVTKGSALKVGISVVDSDGKWKTDFGANVQKDLPADGEWHEYSYNLSTLFEITKKSNLSILQIKIKSTTASSEGYEMGALIDDIDIENASGPSPVEPRGTYFEAGTAPADDFRENIEDTTDKVVVDIKFTNGSDKKVSLMLGDGWDNYFGYFYLYETTKNGDYDGLTVRETKDGYKRFTFELDKLTTIGQGNPEKINLVYIRGGDWTTANGYVEVNPTYSDLVDEYRGTEFISSNDLINDIQEFALTEDFVLDIFFKSSGSTYINVALGDGWSNYFGYYQLSSGTRTGDYDGVTVQALSDGYTRFIFDFDLLNKVNNVSGASSENIKKINLVYIRGAWSTADGYIDINPTADVDIVRGTAFDSSDNIYFELENHVMSGELFTIDVKLTKNSTKISLYETNWGKRTVQFEVTKGGLDKEYEGITWCFTDDGFVRVTLDMTKMTAIDEDKGDGSTTFNEFVYIYFSKATGGEGYYDINPTGGNPVLPPRGSYFDSSADVNFELSPHVESGTNIVIDFKVIKNSIKFVFYEVNWKKRTDIIEVFADGLHSTYQGVTWTMTEDGYVRITLNMTQMTATDYDKEGCDGSPTFSEFSYIFIDKKSGGEGYYELNPSLE